MLWSLGVLKLLNNMKIKKITFFIAICFFTSLVFAANQSLHYKPKIVTLTGIIKIKTFPGAPNYESVELGDDLEPCPYLILDHPIDVIVSPKDQDPNAEPEKNLKIIQIAPQSNSNWNEKYVGKHVYVTGTLYHAIFGHHHTKVLISANYFKLVK